MKGNNRIKEDLVVCQLRLSAEIPEAELADHYDLCSPLSVLLKLGPDENSAQARFRAPVTDWLRARGRVSTCVDYTAACIRADDGWKIATVSAPVLNE